MTCDSVSAIEVTVSELQSQIKEPQVKCEDLENRSYRNNIRLVGVPEEQEGVMVSQFVSSLLHEDEKSLTNLQDLLSSEYTTLICANSSSVRHVS